MHNRAPAVHAQAHKRAFLPPLAYVKSDQQDKGKQRKNAHEQACGMSDGIAVGRGDPIHKDTIQPKTAKYGKAKRHQTGRHRAAARRRTFEDNVRRVTEDQTSTQQQTHSDGLSEVRAHAKKQRLINSNLTNQKQRCSQKQEPYANDT